MRHITPIGKRSRGNRPKILTKEKKDVRVQYYLKSKGFEKFKYRINIKIWHDNDGCIKDVFVTIISIQPVESDLQKVLKFYKW